MKRSDSEPQESPAARRARRWPDRTSLLRRLPTGSPRGCL